MNLLSKRGYTTAFQQIINIFFKSQLDNPVFYDKVLKKIATHASDVEEFIAQYLYPYIIDLDKVHFRVEDSSVERFMTFRWLHPKDQQDLIEDLIREIKIINKNNPITKPIAISLDHIMFHNLSDCVFKEVSNRFETKFLEYLEKNVIPARGNVPLKDNDDSRVSSYDIYLAIFNWKIPLYILEQTEATLYINILTLSPDDRERIINQLIEVEYLKTQQRRVTK